MRLRAKIILCAFLVLFAAASFLTVLADLGVFDRQEPDGAAEGGYALRAWEGHIGVFSPPDALAPRSVTDIRLDGLPASDRLALTAGVPAADQAEVARLLEDYGS